MTTDAKECRNYYMTVKQRVYKTMTEALRQEILNSGMSFKAIERETGVLRQSLMPFARGEQSLRLDMADRLAVYFGIEMVKVRGTKKGRSRGLPSQSAPLQNGKPASPTHR